MNLVLWSYLHTAHFFKIKIKRFFGRRKRNFFFFDKQTKTKRTKPNCLRCNYAQIVARLMNCIIPDIQYLYLLQSSFIKKANCVLELYGLILLCIHFKESGAVCIYTYLYTKYIFCVYNTLHIAYHPCALGNLLYYLKRIFGSQIHGK